MLNIGHCHVNGNASVFFAVKNCRIKNISDRSFKCVFHIALPNVNFQIKILETYIVRNLTESQHPCPSYSLCIDFLLLEATLLFLIPYSNTPVGAETGVLLFCSKYSILYFQQLEAMSAGIPDIRRADINYVVSFFKLYTYLAQN